MNFIQSESPFWACCKGQVLSILLFLLTLLLFASCTSPKSGNRRKRSDKCGRKMMSAWHIYGLVSLWLGQILEADWCKHLSGLFRGPSTAGLSNLWIPDMDHVFHVALNIWLYRPGFLLLWSPHLSRWDSRAGSKTTPYRLLLLYHTISQQETYYLETFLVGMHQLPKL